MEPTYGKLYKGIYGGGLEIWGIWENMGEYGGIWEGAFGPKEVTGIAGNFVKLCETVGKMDRGRVQARKWLNPRVKGPFRRAYFTPLPTGPFLPLVAL